MKTAELLIGKPVYSVDQGQHLGKVSDAYFDPDFQQLTAVVLDSDEGLVGKAWQKFSKNRDERLVTTDKVHVFGVDVLLLPSAEVVVKAAAGQSLSGHILWSAIRGRTLIGQDMKLAVVGDVQLDDSLNVVGITLSKVLVDGKLKTVDMVPRAAVLQHGGSAGHDMTIDLAQV